MRIVSYLRFVVWLSLLALGLGVMHFWLSSNALTTEPSSLKQMLIDHYSFAYLLHLVSFTLIYSLHQRLPDKTGFVFLGLSLLKIMAGVAYLWPSLQAPSPLPEQTLLHFMVPYFCFLIWEVMAVYRLLQR